MVVTRSSLLVNVEQATSFLDQVGDFWNKLGGPISFIYGIAAGIIPLAFHYYKETIDKKEWFTVRPYFERIKIFNCKLIETDNSYLDSENDFIASS